MGLNPTWGFFIITCSDIGWLVFIVYLNMNLERDIGWLVGGSFILRDAVKPLKCVAYDGPRDCVMRLVSSTLQNDPCSLTSPPTQRLEHPI